MRAVIDVTIEDVDVKAGSDYCSFWVDDMVEVTTSMGAFIAPVSDFWHWIDALCDDEVMTVEVEPCKRVNGVTWVHPHSG